MRLFKIRYLFLISTLAVLSLRPASAAFDAFLKIEGIVGESLDRTHPGEMVVSSFSTGIVGGAPGVAGGASGRPAFQELTVVKILDKASPILTMKCALGTHFPTAVLTLRKPLQTPFEFYKITLSDVLISSIATKGSAADAVTESLTLTFRKIQWSYTLQKPDGSADLPITGSWNLDTNAP